MKKKMILFHAFIAIASFPGIGYAHEGDAAAASGSPPGLRTFLFLGLGLLTLIFAVLYVVSRWKGRPAPLWKWASIAFLGLTVLTGTSNILSSAPKNGGGVTMTHIHGMGYTPDGQGLLFAAHDGLKIFSQGNWASGTGEKHDYMGFSSFDEGFYSSGHPAAGSKMKNPFGVVKSTDEGKSLNILSLHGETDFHLLAVSRHNHTIYVFNPEPNSVMKTAGLYYSRDEGKSWTKSEMRGYTGEPDALAVHPANDAFVALGNKEGLYVSTDNGTTFDHLLIGKQVTSVFFDEQGNLYTGATDQKARLIKIDLAAKQAKEVALPALDKKNPVIYMAQNPKDDQELAISSLNRNAYISHDGGTSWHQIADKGKGMLHQP